MKQVLAFALVAALAAGCGRDSRSDGPWQPTMENPPVREIASGKPMPVSRMKPGHVIVSVNGITLTKKDLDDRLGSLRWRLDRSRGMKDRDKDAVYNAYGQNMIDQFVRAQAFAWKGRAEKAADRKTIEDGVAGKTAMMLKTFRLTAEKFDETVPGGLRLQQRIVEDNLWGEKYAEKAAKAAVVVTTETVQTFLKQIADENAAIARTNAMNRARLAGLRREAQAAGTNFLAFAEKAAARQGEGWEGGDWLNLAPENVEEAPLLAKTIGEMAVGSVSDVVEDEESYMILYARSRDEEKSVDLARLSVMKLQPTELMTTDPEAIRQDFQRQEADRTRAELFDTILKEFTVVYPHGTNFWENAK